MKYFSGDYFKSDKEYLKAIIAKGNCSVLSNGRSFPCREGCFLCAKHQELYGTGIGNFVRLVIFCEKLLKKEDIQLELFEEYL